MKYEDCKGCICLGNEKAINGGSTLRYFCDDAGKFIDEITECPNEMGDLKQDKEPAVIKQVVEMYLNDLSNKARQDMIDQWVKQGRGLVLSAVNRGLKIRIGSLSISEPEIQNEEVK